jgi:hypothetical protein
MKKQIEQNISKVRSINAKRTVSYQANLKAQIKTNLIDKKQSVKDNQVLIDRFYAAKPKELTQMQLAFQGAL